MRDRTVLVLEIIRNPCPDSLVIEELSEYEADIDAPLAMVSREDLISVLRQFESQPFSTYELKAWAIRLLGRRDIEFEFGQEGAVVDALFWLAYEEIEEGENSRVCQRIESMLERRRRPR
jgi:hypothetical protein